MKKFLILMSVGLLVGIFSTANASTMDFGTYNTTDFILSYTEDDAKITDQDGNINSSTASMFLTQNSLADNPDSLHIHGLGIANFRFEMTDGSLFNFLGLDIIEYDSGDYSLVGSNGATVGMNPNNTTTDLYQPFTQFNGVSYVDFVSYTTNWDCFIIDNLEYEAGAPVPEPATMLLFGLGLLGLAGVNRRNK